MPSIQSLQPERLDSEDTETAGDEDGDEDEDADGTGLDSKAKETAFSGDGDADGDENEPEPPAIDGETTSTRVAELHSLFASLGTILQLEAVAISKQRKIYKH